MIENIVIFFAIGVVVFSVPICVLRFHRTWLIALVPIYLISANVFAESFFMIESVTLSLAIPLYAGIFFVTDLIHEVYGTKQARRAVFIGLLGQVLFVSMMLAVVSANIMPAKSEAYGQAFGILPRLVAASFIAYFISQLLDIYVFKRIRDVTGEGLLFLRNNISTFVSQFVDTAIFLGIAFYGVSPFEDLSTLVQFGVVVWLAKVFVAIFDTPFLYFGKRIALGVHTHAR